MSSREESTLRDLLFNPRDRNEIIASVWEIIWLYQESLVLFSFWVSAILLLFFMPHDPATIAFKAIGVWIITVSYYNIYKYVKA